MQTLKTQLEKMINSLSAHERDQLKNRLDDLISVYPFNECATKRDVALDPLNPFAGNA